MKKEFSNSWKRSKQPRKQRKFRANAPLHTKKKFLAARLSKELSQKHKMRTIMLRKGDKVKIAVGNYKNHIGKIDHIDIKSVRIFVEGTDRTKTGGTKSLYPTNPSNVIIQELNLEDKRRKEIIDRRQKK
jgi:large subunit ribosomal protein L24